MFTRLTFKLNKHKIFFSYKVSSDGTITGSEIRLFLKKQHNVTSIYKTLETSWNNSITLTGNHLIYARQSTNDKFNPM